PSTTSPSTPPSGATPPSPPPATGVKPVPAPSVPPSPTPDAPRAIAAPTASPNAPRQVGSAVTSTSPAVPATPRFAIEFGPFVTTGDAEGVERQLTQAGFQTARFRQQNGAGLYAVLLERIPSSREAQSLVTTLREQGFAEATLVSPEPPIVRAAEPAPLRTAVEIAEKLRAGG